MALSLPYPNSPQDGDAFLSLPVRSNINAITQAIQSFDGTQVQAGTIAATALAAAANPITRGAETLANFVYVGCTWTPASNNSLLANMTTGVVYINGVRVSVLSVTGKLLVINNDTYVDVDTFGNLYYLPVANAAAAPPLTANSVRLAKLVTNATLFATVVQNGVDSLFNPIDPISPLKLVSNIFGQSLQSYVNAGTAGGTWSYINLGGIKLLWGQSAGQINAATGPQFSLNLPVSFFNSIQAATCSWNAINTQSQQTLNVISYSTSLITFIGNSPQTTTAQIFSAFVIGT